jgi:methionyl aminopeptidase
MILIKSAKQIEGIRRSSRMAAECLEYVKPFVEPGRTTGELDSLIENHIRSRGAYPAPLGYQGYPKATCISVNEVVCHGIPGPLVLKEGDLVGIDVTTIYRGYFGDCCVTLPVGNVSEVAGRLIGVTSRCLEAGIAAVKPGNRFGRIGAAIAALARAEGCSVVETFCGHGTGVQFHEEPRVLHVCPEDSGPYMRPGMVFTIEPMINLGVPDVVICEQDGWTARTADGKLSAQFEHTVLVTEDGCEILTLPRSDR